MEQKFGPAGGGGEPARQFLDDRGGNGRPRGAADGLTLFMATVAQTLNPAQTKSGFDLGKQMAPVALLGVVPNMLVAHPDVPVKNR